MMRKRVCTSILIAATTAIGALSALAQTPIWVEDFDGPEIDRSVWTFDAGDHGFGNGELQYHTARPENARIENGNLIIEARRENYFSKQFTSSRLTTQGRFAFKYGTIQARIKIPDLADGLWPAFWLLGNNIGQNGWPSCGEIDILEMGMAEAIANNRTNRQVSGAAHWDYQGNYANYGASLVAGQDLSNGYHIFRLEWTPTLVRTLLDGQQYWAMNINDVEGSSLEEFHEPFFIILNLAVGGYNFVDITDPNLITAPFPAQMQIDWIELYDNGFTELYFTGDEAETGNFGIATDTTPVNNHITFGDDTEFYIWNNMTAISDTPYEGSNVMAFNIGAGNWFGAGVYCKYDRNMKNYSDGHIHFHAKTTTTGTIGIGLSSSAGGEGWLDLVNGGEEFGLVRDGQWHEVVIPLSRFDNIDFNTLNQLFMIRGDAPAAAFDLALDNIYWSPSVARPAPENGSYGIFTDNPAHQTAGSFAFEVDGNFYVWENTLQALATTPYEGGAVMSFTTAPGLGWFGAAFTPNIKHNLSAFRYPESVLHFAMKTNSNTKFRIGMKSGSVADIGQLWITFEPGNDPYGFVRDGQWHVIEIPMSDIAGTVDLTQVNQLFELLGVDGAISDIALDDICLLNGGAAIPQFAAGDVDGDGDVDYDDFGLFSDCMAGPGVHAAPSGCTAGTFADCDFDADNDVDLNDAMMLFSAFAQ